MNASLEFLPESTERCSKTYTVTSDGTTADGVEAQEPLKFQPTCGSGQDRGQRSTCKWCKVTDLVAGPVPLTTDQMLGVKHPTVGTSADHIGVGLAAENLRIAQLLSPVEHFTGSDWS